MFTNVSKFLFFVLFVSLLQCVVCDDRIVYSVTDDSYEGLFSRHDDMIIYFSNEGPSDELEENLKSLTDISTVGFVNCKTDEDPCLDNKVSKKMLPTVVLNSKKKNFWAGEASDFAGIREWAHNSILGKTVVVRSLEDTEQLKEGNWVIKFFAPWCGHCKKLAPVWTQVSLAVDDAVNTAKVDCSISELKDFCSEHEITGFPTMQAWKDGDLKSTFDGDRNFAGILRWANKAHSTLDDEVHDEL